MMAVLQQLIEALRHELQQYGEMLALLDHQQELIRMRGGDDILHSLTEINAQSAVIQCARSSRQVSQQQLAVELGQGEEATFGQLLPLLPSHYRPLISALVQENNELLLRVRKRAQQNQGLLHRSVELMQRFITTLAPEDRIAPTPEPSHPVAMVEPGSTLYEALV